jgi:ribosome-binding ATPase
MTYWKTAPSFGGEEAIEVYHYDDLLACGSEAKVKEKGLFRLEGKDYVIKEADMVYFRFNV